MKTFTIAMIAMIFSVGCANHRFETASLNDSAQVISDNPNQTENGAQDPINRPPTTSQPTTSSSSIGYAFAHQADGKLHLIIAPDSLDRVDQYRVRTISSNTGEVREFTQRVWQSASYDFNYGQNSVGAADRLEVFYGGQWREFLVNEVVNVSACRPIATVRAGNAAYDRILRVTNPCAHTVFYRLSKQSMPFSQEWATIPLNLAINGFHDWALTAGEEVPEVEESATVAYYRKIQVSQ